MRKSTNQEGAALGESCPLHASSLIALHRKVRRPFLKRSGSASAWIILLKASNSINSYNFTLLDTPLKTKDLSLAASAE